MQTSKTAGFAAALAVSVLAFAGSASASSYSAVVVYGDSLSDNGNLYAATKGFAPAAPYYQGRFSNGPVAVEQLAGMLGVPLLDFAFGGATTGLGNQGDGGTQTAIGGLGLPGMLAEFSAFHAPAAIVPSALFVVWGGANDYELGESVNTAVKDIDTIVAGLQKQGATHILVPGLPDLGLTPEFFGVADATQFSQQFNAGLIATLPAGATYDDVYGLLNTIVGNKTAYGFSDVTTACFDGVSALCSNPNQHLFFDHIHPTTAADAILAQQFDAVVTTATPEPSSFVLLGSGIVGALGMIRRRTAA